jgi:signal transduction histidine kinase
MDGFEVCARLKAEPGLKDIPVIFLTAHTGIEEKTKAFGMGCVDYVTKPFHGEEIHARVATHLELRRKTRALEESYAKLAGLEKLRDSLVHMLVHDLRSPLTALCGCLELVEEDAGTALSPEMAADLRTAREAARKMILQVSTILDVSKMEEGQLVPRREEFDLAELIGEVLQGVGSLKTGRELSVEPVRVPATLSADRELVTRLLQNLLCNALKFTPRGGSIRLRVEALDHSLRVSIADTGPGIPAGYREKIFEKFAQVEAQAAGLQLPSSGLGLAFCKLAVAAHGGRIGVESEEGAGSTFWFVLPRRAPAAE